MMLHIAFKPDVRMTEAHWDQPMVELIRGLLRTAPDLCSDTMMVTSADDSGHMRGSCHYIWRALDIRYTGKRPGGVVVDFTPHSDGGVPRVGTIKAEQRAGAVAWVNRAEQLLGPDYDIVVEGDHIHAEHDPKAHRA